MFTGENALASGEVSVHTFNFNDGIHEGDLSGFDPT